jgi:predicted secreted protein
MRISLFLRPTAFAGAAIIAGSVLIGCSGYSSGGSTPAAPMITTQPASQTVTAGQVATFTVVATGTAPLSYQWQKNGAAISAATSSSYATPATTTADNGAQFRVVVSNSAGSVTSSAATLTVNSGPPPQLQITTTSLPNGQLQTAYSATLQATGGTTPYSWSITSGSLPTGLTLAATTGVIGGTPTAAGTFPFSVKVSDNAGNSAFAPLTIVITATTAAAPFGHIVIVLEENTNYTNVVGSSQAPYLNSLMTQYGSATQYYANTHPSIGNYMMLTTGQVLTNDDSQTPQSFPVSAGNVVRELLAAGKSWKSYAEDLPSVGYTGGDTGNYAVRHNPLAYMTDVQNNASQQQNLAPFTQFAQDLAAGSLPDFSFIVPNLCDDAHDCSLSVADSWLKTNIDPLIKNPVFQKDGLLIVVFDESGNDNTHGGGRVVAALVSPASSKPGYSSTTLYQHQSVLRLTLEGLGVKALPGSAASAPAMWEFFTFVPPA